VTLFPCLVRINQNAQSIIAITNITTSKNGDNLSVRISNIEDYPINAQLSIYAPPDFTIANASRNITLKAYSSTNTSFMLSTPQYTNSEFPIIAAASYVSNNVHYATLAETTISFGGAAGSSPSTLTDNLLLFGIVALIIIIIILIVLSVIMKKGKRKKITSDEN
jgi:hypothetical protein